MQNNFTQLIAHIRRTLNYPLIAAALVFIMLFLANSASAQTQIANVNFSNSSQVSSTLLVGSSINIESSGGVGDSPSGRIVGSNGTLGYEGYFVLTTPITFEGFYTYTISVQARRGNQGANGRLRITSSTTTTVEPGTTGTSTLGDFTVTNTAFSTTNSSSTYTITTSALSGSRHIGFYLGRVTGNNNEMYIDNIVITRVCNNLPAPTVTNGSNCGPGQVTLQASGAPIGGTFQWYTQPSGGSPIAGATGSTFITPTISQTTTYYVSVNANTCNESPRTAVTATINEIPNAVIVGTTAICSGSSATLNASGAPIGGSYRWYTVATGGTAISANLSGTGNSTYSPTLTNLTNTPAITSYYVEAINPGNLGGCVSTTRTRVDVTVNPLPTVTLNYTPTCEDTETTLTANASGGTGQGTYTYEWIVPNTVTNPGNVASFKTTTAGYYSVRVIDQNSCQNSVTAEQQVTFIPRPTATLNYTPTCVGTATTIAANPSGGTGPYTYNWTVLPAGVNNPGNVASFSTEIPGTYSVVVTDKNGTGCTSTTISANVIFNSLPTVSLTSPPACIGTDATITATVTNGTGPFIYNWVVPTGATAPGNTVGSFTTSVPGEYRVSVTDVNGCTSSAVATITISFNPLPATPTITAAGSTTFCLGGSVTLTADDSPTATNFTWYKGNTVVQTGSNPSYSANETGNYTVVATDDNTCSSLASNVIEVFVLTPQNIITGGPGNQRSFCEGSEATLTALTGGTYTYQWFFSTDATANNGNETSAGQTSSITVNTPGFYYLILTGANGCGVTSEVITLERTPAIDTNKLDPKTPICEGTAPGFITGNVTGGNGSYVYKWEMSTTSATTGFTEIDGATTQTLNYTQTLTQTTWFRRTVTSVNCFDVSDALEVTVIPLPTAAVNANGPLSFCFGGNVTLTASAGDSWAWYKAGNSQPVATSQSYVVAESGNYTVVVTTNGCSATSNAVTVTVNPLPVVSISSSVTPVNGSIAICDGTTVTLTANPGPPTGTSYAWSNGETSRSITVNEGGDYTVTVTNANSCFAPATATVTVKSVPTVSIQNFSNPTTIYTVYTGDGNIPLQGLANGAAVTGTFAINGTPISGNTLTTCNGGNLGPVNGVVDNVSFTYEINGCSVTATAQFLLKQSTYAVIIDAAPFPVCSGQNTQYTATVYRDATIIYPYLTDANGQAVIDPATTFPRPNPDYPIPASDPAYKKASPFRFYKPIVTGGVIVNAGANASLFNYQWIKNNINNVGSNDPSRGLAGLSSTEYYTVKVEAKQTLACNISNFTDESNRIYLGMPDAHTISISASPNPVCSNSTDPVIFTATPNATAPFDWDQIGLVIEWFRNNEAIPFGSGLTASLLPSQLNNNDQIRIEFSSTLAGCKKGAQNGVLTMTVNQPPAITATGQPQVTVAACVGQSANFSVQATGTNLNFTWFKVGDPNFTSAGTSTNNNGVITNTLTLSNVQLADNNSQYYVIISGTCSPTVQSNNATLTVNPLPDAPTGSDQEVCSTGSLTQTLTATATAPAGTSVIWYTTQTGFTTTTTPTQVGVGTKTYWAASQNTTTNCISSTRTPVILTIVEPDLHSVVIDGENEPEIGKPATYTAVTIIDAVITPNVPATYIWSITILGQAKKTYISSDPDDGITINGNTLTIEEIPEENMTIEVQETITDGRCIAPLAATAILTDINPLPVELLYLKATKQNNDVVALEWATAMEQNSEGFEVQVSQDAQNYRTLAFVASKAGGNTNQKQVYTFHDKENGKYGTRYYRLMQRDMNGDSEYFGPKAVKIGDAAESMSVYPNPFSQEVTLTVNAEAGGSMHVLVTNAIGAKVLERTLTIQKGSNKQNLQFNNNLPQGIYHITTHLNGKVQHFKLLKQQ
ncbi:MAG: T9SS type A sorting domain-containing protein [Adhaeribacter sp.]